MRDQWDETEREAMGGIQESSRTDDATLTTVDETVVVPESDNLLPCGHTPEYHQDGIAGIATRMLNLAADLRATATKDESWSPDLLAAAEKWDRDERAVVAQLAEAFTSLMDGDLEQTMAELQDRGHDAPALVLAMVAQKAQHDTIGRIMLEAILSSLDGDHLMAFISLIQIGADRLRLTDEDLRTLRTGWHH